jgi:hypothetical protein
MVEGVTTVSLKALKGLNELLISCREEKSLEPFLPYLETLPLTSLITAFSSAERELLFPRLLDAARLTQDAGLEREIEVVRGQQEERRKRSQEAARVVAEVKPILAVRSQSVFWRCQS